jgi:hypothetical protein
MQVVVFQSLPFWSVNYSGGAFDDARRADDGIWHYRHIATRQVLCFTYQERVVVLCKNRTYPSTNF